jgi:hypothetical protein
MDLREQIDRVGQLVLNLVLVVMMCLIIVAGCKLLWMVLTCPLSCPVMS